ncbi:MAG: ABC transporter ATP-binding protein [Deltaproteobacteria bacterium]|nr:ABC transporter ATP-binding protein [Deltaproteobacteria bacterium]
MTPTDKPLLDTRGLCKYFGGVEALNRVSLLIHSGEIRGLIGPNGAGKTCLLNLLSGLYSPSGGTIVYEGLDITRKPSRVRPYLGIARTFQVAQVCPEMTVLENVLLGFYRGMEQSALAAILRPGTLKRSLMELEKEGRELLRFVELSEWEQVPAARLAYGQRKILEVARALAGDPRLLLLDEPTAGLNPSEVEKLKGYVVETNRRGATILLVEHNMRLVMDLCQRVTVLSSGAIISEGSAAEIQSDKGVVEAYLGRRWSRA